MTKNNQIILSKSIIILLLFAIIYYEYWLEAYWLLAVYIPIILTLIHSYKKQDASAINKLFKYYTWFLIILSVIFLIGSYLYAAEYYNNFSSSLAWFGDNTIINLPKIAIILLLAMLLKLNDNLDE